MEQKLQKSGLAIASLILGLVSFIPIPLVGVLLGITAVILGIVSLRQIKKMGLDGKKMAIGGVVLGIAGIVFTFAIYGSLFYFGFVSDKGPWAELKPKVSQQILTQNAGALELYKSPHLRTGYSTLCEGLEIYGNPAARPQGILDWCGDKGRMRLRIQKRE